MSSSFRKNYYGFAFTFPFSLLKRDSFGGGGVAPFYDVIYLYLYVYPQHAVFENIPGSIHLKIDSDEKFSVGQQCFSEADITDI